MIPGLDSHRMPLDLFLAVKTKLYYKNRKKIFGEAGDFITATFSQLFCHSLASYFYLSISEREEPITLVELGPGEGKLMVEILTFLQREEQIFSRIKQIVLVESSPSLVEIQRANLAKFSIPILHFQDFMQFKPEESFFLVANEFFDALPIKQFIKVKGQYHEIWVDLLKKELLLHPQAFSPGLLEENLMKSRLKEVSLQEGALYEFSPSSLHLIEFLGEKLQEKGGKAIILDYGYDKPPLVNTIRAIKNHQILEDFLDFSNELDLSASVDFTALKSTIDINYPSLQTRLLKQKDFLQENFLIDLIKSASKLAKNDEEKKALQAEIALLESMNQFKVLEIIQS